MGNHLFKIIIPVVVYRDNERECAVSIGYYLLRVAPTFNPIANNFSLTVNALTKLDRC